MQKWEFPYTGQIERAEKYCVEQPLYDIIFLVANWASSVIILDNGAWVQSLWAVVENKKWKPPKNKKG